jgi:hypothetical protein
MQYHSVPLAELLGLAAGALGGWAGSKIANHVVDKNISDNNPGLKKSMKVLATGLGTFAGHAAASGITKAGTNLAMGDILGAGTVTPYTTGGTSLAHATINMMDEAMASGSKKLLTATADEVYDHYKKKKRK